MAKAIAHFSAYDNAFPEYALCENGYVFFRTTSFDQERGHYKTTKWTPMPQTSYYMHGTSALIRAVVRMQVKSELINDRNYLVMYDNLKLKLPNLT